MTLAELTVFMFLLLLLSTATYTVYILSMRYMRIAQAALELQAAAQRAVASLEMDIGDSDASTIITISNPTGVIFATPRDANSLIQTGPVWQAWLGYYIDASHNLVRKRVTVSPPGNSYVLGTTNTLPTNTWTATTFLNAAGTTNIVASYDTSLACSVLATGAVTFTGTFTISVQSPGDCQINIQDSIWPRN